MTDIRQSGVEVRGIHHITAIAGEPRRNLHFYAGVLGQRLVKRTVNFDDPGTYHLYYGDEAGNPGTIMTFFAWPGAPRGRGGAGQVTATSYAVPAGSLGWWHERVSAAGVEITRIGERFEAPMLGLRDPDGMPLELIETADGPGERPWSGSAVPASKAIRGFHGATLTERALEPTARVIEDQLAWSLTAEEADRFRYSAPGGDPGRHLDVVVRPDAPRGSMAAGAIHHIAFRLPDDGRQAESREAVTRAGLPVSPVMDRQYFRSIYFREPGGVLFEMATDPPGFTRDESLEDLGRDLQLPPWLESRRGAIERSLPPLGLPVDSGVEVQG